MTKEPFNWKDIIATIATFITIIGALGIVLWLLILFASKLLHII